MQGHQLVVTTLIELPSYHMQLPQYNFRSFQPSCKVNSMHPSMLQACRAVCALQRQGSRLQEKEEHLTNGNLQEEVLQVFWDRVKYYTGAEAYSRCQQQCRAARSHWQQPYKEAMLPKHAGKEQTQTVPPRGPVL